MFTRVDAKTLDEWIVRGAPVNMSLTLSTRTASKASGGPTYVMVAGRPLRSAIAAQEPGVYARRRDHAGPRRRRQHRDLQCRQCGDAAAVAVLESRSARQDLGEQRRAWLVDVCNFTPQLPRLAGGDEELPGDGGHGQRRTHLDIRRR